MMDHNKFSDWHPDNTDYRLHGKAWYKKDNITMSPYGISSALPSDKFNEISAVSRGHNYANEFYYEDIPSLFSGSELDKVYELYREFMKQVDKTQEALNIKIFFNHKKVRKGPLSDANKVRSSYDRVVAMGILEGWSPEEFKVALGEIFPAKLKDQELGLEDVRNSDHGKFPGELLKEDYAFFYNKDEQQGNITAFNEFIRDSEAKEEGYDGEDSPLVRAKKLYPNDALRQIIYAFNIVIAFQIRKTKEQLRKGDTSHLNSLMTQELWAVFNELFRPSR
jgi:hypothetical protein